MTENTGPIQDMLPISPVIPDAAMDFAAFVMAKYIRTEYALNEVWREFEWIKENIYVNIRMQEWRTENDGMFYIAIPFPPCPFR